MTVTLHPCECTQQCCIRNKSIVVELLLNAIDYDIVCFVETYLTSEDTSAKYLAGCGDVYDLFRCDRTSRAGGGVAVYCKHCLNPARLAVPDTFSDVEAVCTYHYHSTRILCRPPNCNSIYSDNVCELITYFVSGSDNIVIFGDFYLPAIEWSSYSYPSTRLYQSFMDCIMENALTQHVTVPTRETNVLDLIISTDPMVVSRVTASDNFRFLDKVSDHSALICTINLSYVSPTLHQSQSHFDFRRADFVALKVSLSCINWRELLCNCPTIDAMLITFLDTFLAFVLRVCLLLKYASALLETTRSTLKNCLPNVNIYRNINICRMAFRSGVQRRLVTCLLFSNSLTTGNVLYCIMYACNYQLRYMLVNLCCVWTTSLK